MTNPLNRLSITYRIVLLVIVMAAGMTVILAVSAAFIKNVIYEQHTARAKLLVDTTQVLLHQYVEDVNAGKATLDHAQKTALARVARMNTDQNSYFWINDADGNFLVHPMKDVVGKNFLHSPGIKPPPFMVEFAKAAKFGGGGIYQYYWPIKNGRPKISSVRGLPEWQWAIGHGFYTDDVDNEVNAAFASLSGVCAVLLLFAVILAILIGRSVSRPIRSISNAMEELAAGNHNVSIPEEERRDEIGRMQKAVAVFIQHARRVAQMDEERAETDKLKSEFVSVVSHELRTPLTSVYGSLVLVTGAMSQDVPPKALHLLRIAQNNCVRLTSLINDLLDINKIAAGQLRLDITREPLAPLLQQVVEAHAGFAASFHVSCILDHLPDDLFINIDKERFAQILSNLLSNAAKFSLAGGKITIAARRTGGRIRISVIDYGIGIPEEFRSRVFGKFTQADSSLTRRNGGTGLGLHITKKLVELMEGEIGFISETGMGTEFWVEFPEAVVAAEHEQDALP